MSWTTQDTNERDFLFEELLSTSRRLAGCHIFRATSTLRRASNAHCMSSDSDSDISVALLDTMNQALLRRGWKDSPQDKIQAWCNRSIRSNALLLHGQIGNVWNIIGMPQEEQVLETSLESHSNDLKIDLVRDSRSFYRMTKNRSHVAFSNRALDWGKEHIKVRATLEKETRVVLMLLRAIIGRKRTNI